MGWASEVKNKVSRIRRYAHTNSGQNEPSDAEVLTTLEQGVTEIIGEQAISGIREGIESGFGQLRSLDNSIEDHTDINT